MTISYRVRHTTRFDYSLPVSVCHNILCLKPRSTDQQSLEHFDLRVLPRPVIQAERVDAFGNSVHAIAIEEAHAALEVTARSLVVVRDPPRSEHSPAWEEIRDSVQTRQDPGWLSAVPYRFDSPLAFASPAARAFVDQFFTPGRPLLEATFELTKSIYDKFAYRSGATAVDTTSEQALELAHGVCQDFAHVAIASIRSLGLSARYSSGYLRTVPPPGKPRLVGADESHAWFGVYGGAEIGWVDFDPTNGVLVGPDHVLVANGRDYRDVAPIRGVFLGGGESRLSVEVDVEPLNRNGPNLRLAQ